MHGDPDIDFEPEDELGAGALTAKLQKLRDELEKAKTERQEYLDGWQRCKADSVNARKEALAAAERAGKRALEAFIESLIPALDGFDAAAAAEAWATMDDGWKSGMEHIRDSLIDVLRGAGVERFGKIGDAFDPALHEAVQEMPDAAGEPHTIVRIFRFGYRTKERVVRPAQVAIKA